MTTRSLCTQAILSTRRVRRTARAPLRPRPCARARRASALGAAPGAPTHRLPLKRRPLSAALARTGYALKWNLFNDRLMGLADRVPYLLGQGNHVSAFSARPVHFLRA